MNGKRPGVCEVCHKDTLKKSSTRCLKHVWVGRKHTAISRARMSSSRIGYKHDQKTLEKLRGRVPWNKGISFMAGSANPRWINGASLHPDYNKLTKHIRRARKFLNGGRYSLDEWDALKKRYNYMCLCCKQQEPFIKLSADHVVPLACGGSNDISNIQPLCIQCNNRKSIKIIDFRFNPVNTEKITM